MSATFTGTIGDAAAELERLFGELDVEPDGSGGAYITVRALALGERWTPGIVPLSFQVAYNYPHAAVYPYYVPAGLARTDGGAWPAALQAVDWRGQPMVQVSLRANRWSPAHDSAAGAVAQVRHFFQTAS